MRLFVAVDLGAAVRARLEHTLDALRPRAPKAKWVRAEKLHVTLVFLGNVSDDRVEAVADAMSLAATRHRPFELRARGGGGFGSGRKPRVLWVGIEGDVDALAALQRDVEAVLVPLGHEPEQRAYKPHLTLARAGDPRGDASLATCVEELAHADLGATRVSEVILFQSRLSPKGATYEPVRVAPLAGG